jgi:flagellar basal-body rod protein FlgG
MNAQQANIDNVAHNLANVNTTGFKKSRVEFEDLVYQQIKAPGTPTQESVAPVGLEAGLGSRAVATARNFSAGNLRSTGGTLDLAIEGQGFFQITLPGGETGYTRAGTFHMSGEGQIVTAEGYALQPAITIPANATSVTVGKDGVVSVGVPGQGAPQQVGTLAQGFVEDSNVSVVEEMVNMILGQRAYEANSRVIRAADEMLQQVNNLSR